MGFIEELYYGNVRPAEKCFERGTSYAKAVELFCDNEKKLLDSLREEELTLFNELLNAGDEISATSEIENFKQGFSLGVQMMCDCFINKNDRIFKDTK